MRQLNPMQKVLGWNLSIRYIRKSVDVILENANRLEKKVYSLLFLNRIDYMMDQEKETDKTTEMYKLINDVLVSFKMISQSFR